MFVFLDETAVNTNLTRLPGWAPQGERLTMDAPFDSWGTQTLIAGLTADAFIAPWVIKGAMDGPAFATYVWKDLIPGIAPGTAVILDNLATHRVHVADCADFSPSTTSADQAPVGSPFSGFFLPHPDQDQGPLRPETPPGYRCLWHQGA